MARVQFTALDVNASGTDEIHVGGDITATDLNGINDIFLDDINADGTKIDLDDDMDIGAISIYSDSSNCDINESGLGTNPVQIGPNQSRAGTEEDLEVYDDCNIDGTLSKGSGSFKIEHPLDPENKYLYHSFVESPEMRNAYYGQVETINKKVIVKMPDWWHALNGTNKSEFTYHLTPIGKQANLWISKEMENGEFEISSDVDCKVSWQVTAIRHDKFAEENRVQVEVPKNKKIIEKNPNMWMVSDLYDYDEESDTFYKIKKKDLFFKKKPYMMEAKKLNNELKNIRNDRKELNKKSKSLVITGKSKEEIIEKANKRTEKEKKEIEKLRKDIESNRQKKRDCKEKLKKCTNKMRQINAEWKLERNKKRGLIKDEQTN